MLPVDVLRYKNDLK